MAQAALELRPADIVLAYHARTKHRRERYAAGPETIDWTSPPDPFRLFAGSPRVTLPFGAASLDVSYGDILSGTAAPQPLSRASIGMLLELSMAISAWKQQGPDRWAVRCAPSSGNLHPTEAYLAASGVTDLADGVYHYDVREHALEQRFAPAPGTRPRGLWIGLSSIHWREAWKYGERAFRYCQLDIGHALGALHIAAGLLGWRLKLTETRGEALASLLGTDRRRDFSGVEQEEPELLLSVAPNMERAAAPPDIREGIWHGHANMLDCHPMYHWPVIDEAAAATRGGTASRPDPQPFLSIPALAEAQGNAARLILGRRSAQHFDPGHTMSAAKFFRLLDGTLPRNRTPWNIWDFAPRLHLLLFVHRVEGLEPGLYALPRRAGTEWILKAALDPGFDWQRVGKAPAHLPLYRLAGGDLRKTARLLSCLQAIAGESCFSLGMVAEFSTIVETNPWRYRQLHWEAGLIGHMLYLDAESLGLRGTGIGCFFDDDVHRALGIDGAAFQSLYHFTIGKPLTDHRIATQPPYPSRPQKEQKP